MSLRKLFTINLLTPGRRSFALKIIASRAESIGAMDIAQKARLALKTSQDSFILSQQWAKQKQKDSEAKLIKKKTAELDVQIEKTISHIYNICEVFIQSFDADHPKYQFARDIHTTLFPSSLYQVIQQPYIDKLAWTQQAIKDLKGPLQDAAHELSLEDHVELLETLSKNWDALLQKHQNITLLSYDQVTALNDQAQEEMLEVLAMILGTFHDGKDPEHLKHRLFLIEPILNQNEKLKEYRRRHIKIDDVDPESGQSLNDSNASFV